MPTIEGFPDDDALWFVKWVDGFKLPHLSTSSAAVRVLLQQLNFQDPAQLEGLKPADVAQLLGKHHRAQDPTFAAPLPKVHVGVIPHLAIGRVFRRQECVGELPRESAVLYLERGEDSCEEVTLDQRLSPPAQWGDRFPYGLLHVGEYSGLKPDFAQSRCLVHVQDGIEYIIPRTVIFHRFYGQTSLLARTFLSGPWPSVSGKLIREKPLKSGLQTQINKAEKRWEIILQTVVPNAFADILAVFRFDKHGSACAQSIYSMLLQDRGARGDKLAYSSARLPFQADGKPLRLQVRGYALVPRFGRPPGGGKWEQVKQSFLVTSIPDCSWPDYLWPVGRGRANSGDKGLSQGATRQRKPFAGVDQTRPGAAGTRVLSTVDGRSDTAGVAFIEDTHSYSDAPPIIKLQKESSDPSEGDGASKEKHEDQSESSTSNRNQKGSSKCSSTFASLVQTPLARYESLHNAFEKLRENGVVSAFSVVQPQQRLQVAHRASRICWNFLDEDMRMTGDWPQRSWRILGHVAADTEDELIGIPRSALILRFETSSFIGYWIEIETRDKEAYLSPMLMHIDQSAHEAISHVVERIAQANGVGLRTVIAQGVEELAFGSYGFYKHQYVTEASGSQAGISYNSVERFIRAHGASARTKVST